MPDTHMLPASAREQGIDKRGICFSAGQITDRGLPSRTGELAPAQRCGTR
jgi:hypothetical protein